MPSGPRARTAVSCAGRLYYTPTSEEGRTMQNAQIAEALDEIGQLLELQGQEVYRVRAYHNAADAIRRWPAPVDQLAARGELAAIPGVGKALVEKVSELVSTGQLRYLEDLRASFPPGLF